MVLNPWIPVGREGGGGGAPFGLNRDFPLDTVTVFRVFCLVQGMPVHAHYMYLFEIL